MNFDDILKNAPTPQVELFIAEMQGIQKRYAPSTPQWQLASSVLKPLFEEMARRTAR